ncbi:MAG: [FeFe] hydrogenase, group A [Clostridiales bacterium]|nr:[FeFe] hydrogenase, group A [Clostridiales bacterium]MDD6107644.1 [FeFe] hydrogenase, group A [Clostridiales bacterium]MDD6937369.1 [FeFe] hydrogenase, group A [Clostridiales bacterium]MDY2961476.1 [FeFe] hydrogenase, group A [Oscillospiraceae bacterium]
MAEKMMIIDGVQCPFTNERNVLEVARNNGIDIPSLCYCENLSIYGGCRLCLVENERGAMDAACSMQPKNGLVVNTHTEKVLESRRTTLQLLMSSHRAQCLTCDKSGKCKLQDYAKRYGVDDTRFGANTYCREPKDESSKSIVRDPSKCILCGLCVRMCDEVQNIGAIDFTQRGKKAYVAPGFGKTLAETSCVGCGQCAAVCPTGAITIKNEVPKMWKMLHNKDKKVVVQFAPSVRVGMAEEFGMPANEAVTGKLVTALRRLGADVVYDTNLTADLTIMEESAEFLEKVKTGAKLPMFTSCCPGWIQHVEHKHPHLMPQVSTCGSPMEMFGALIRQQFKGEDVFSVAIMPCTAKKFEAARPELEKDGERLIDLVLTTTELVNMIKEAGIDFANLPDSEPDDPLGDYTGAGVIFGVTGGVTEAVIRRVLDDASPDALKTIAACGVRGLEGIKAFSVTAGDLTIKIAVANGLGNADKLIEKVESGEESFDFIEVMACPNGCIGGGGQPPASNKRKAERFDAIFKEDEACELKLPQQNPDLTYVYDELLKGRAHDLLHIHYPAHGHHE